MLYSTHLRFTLLSIISSLFILNTTFCFSQSLDYNAISIKCINRDVTDEELKNYTHKYELTKTIDSISMDEFFVNSIIKHPDFIEQICLQLRFWILKGSTFEDVYRQIEEFEILSMMLPLKMNDAAEKKMYNFESKRLYEVYMLYDYLARDSITIEEMHQILFNNFIYDTQNMGDDNFIVSTFQYCMGRNPTAYELSAGKKMINGFSSYLFYKQGESKSDYLNIITSNNNFYEHQVNFWYYYFQLEFPSKEKANEILVQTKDFYGFISSKNIIKYILLNEK